MQNVMCTFGSYTFKQNLKLENPTLDRLTGRVCPDISSNQPTLVGTGLISMEGFESHVAQAWERPQMNTQLPDLGLHPSLSNLPVPADLLSSRRSEKECKLQECKPQMHTGASLK